MTLSQKITVSQNRFETRTLVHAFDQMLSDFSTIRQSWRYKSKLIQQVHYSNTSAGKPPYHLTKVALLLWSNTAYM